MNMTNEEYKELEREAWQEYIKGLSDRSKFREIKEDLREIKATLKKMQEEIQLLENKN